MTNEVFAGIRASLKYWVTTLRSSILGIIIGIVPGISISIGSFMGYIVEQKLVSKGEAKTFGSGNIRGVIALPRLPVMHVFQVNLYRRLHSVSQEELHR